MAVRPHRVIVAVALLFGVAACSSAPIPTLEETAKGVTSPTPSAERTIAAKALDETENAGPKAADTNDLVTLVSDKADVDQRVFRPPLQIDDKAIGSRPAVLPDGAKISYVVVDLNRGDIIAADHADQRHIPASSAKLATAVAALDLLGPDYRFRTELRATGSIENGVLKGDLILKGGGDPLLDIPDLLPLIDELARLPLRRIDGRFLIDDGALPRLTEIEPTQPTEAAYNPGLGALSLAFNRVNLSWQNRGTFSAETIPHLDGASFEHVARKRLPPGGVQLKHLDGDDTVWQLADRGARRSKRSLPVKDPGLHAGRVFANLAALHGVDLPEPVRAEQRAESQLIAAHESRALRELVRDMLWYSNNLVAELIGLAAAKTVKPELASLEDSADVLLGKLKTALVDTSWEGVRLDNHSGLSSDSRLTPAQLAAILRLGWQEGLLRSSLPGSGWSGTLAKRFDAPDQAFRIWAKTGSMNYVSALGGYLLSEAHAPAAFVVMISDEKARRLYDAAPQRTRAGEKKANAWNKRAEKAMNQLIEGWLESPSTSPPRDQVAMSQSGG